MSFAITFNEDLTVPDYYQPGDVINNAQIVIDDFEEGLTIPTDYWSKRDYLLQWVDAVQRVLADEEKSSAALITEMYGPVNAKYAIMLWPIYRMGEVIYIRNEYLPLKEVGLNRPFTMDELYDKVLPREEGERVSEWKSSTKDFEQWLTKLKKEVDKLS